MSGNAQGHPETLGISVLAADFCHARDVLKVLETREGEFQHLLQVKGLVFLEDSTIVQFETVLQSLYIKYNSFTVFELDVFTSSIKSYRQNMYEKYKHEKYT